MKVVEPSQVLFSLETLVITVSAGAVAALVVGFVTGYCCGRRCGKDAGGESNKMVNSSNGPAAKLITWSEYRVLIP